eukprot:CAMPEP_0114609596 /NCGR_PEP_ID=MMETSP0168-20121206/3169_1 /TAXON_ID=95228 ORGANISM="Vannella sp., Strain DIVA3 517/6/12" /NCGR_SAMPLE_ID=MMETSP0168 /ASSEMBLY_ACC=CAM_ASM_000044 /LENGTH=625 /DNA_ID=CAMNT_0001820517 /DNA_START=56 /DNA_END=1930 /DNA_ORIENTATION=-
MGAKGESRGREAGGEQSAGWLGLSRLHICALSGSASLVFQHLLTGSYYPELSLVVFLDWFIVNALNRIVDEKEDRANGVTVGKITAAQKAVVYGFCLLALLASFSLHFVGPSLHPALFLPRLFGLVLSLAYNYRILPVPGVGMVRLKEVYFLKNLSSCSGFLLTLFGYPLACAGWAPPGIPSELFPATISLGPHVDFRYLAVLILYFGLLEIGFEVIYDIRDMAGDVVEGVSTYAVVHGQDTAVTIVGVLDALAVEALAIGLWLGYIEFREFMLIWGVLLQYVIFRAFLCSNASSAASPGRCITPAQTTVLTWTFVGAMVTYIAHERAGFSQEFGFGPLSTARVIDVGLVVVGVFTWLWNRKEMGTELKFWCWYAGIGLGGALAENTCIHIYEFYHYNQTEWLVYVGVMPLEVCLIWPQVIFGIRRVLRKAGLKGVLLATVGAGEVTFQALFMEVCCVNAGLWYWSKDNVFGVPFIGALGWSLFGWMCLLCMEYLNGSNTSAVIGSLIVLPIAGTLFVHVGLVVMWQYLGFDWISDITFSGAVATQFMSYLSVGALLFAIVAAFTCPLCVTPVQEYPRLLAGQLIVYILCAHNPSRDLILFALCPSISYFGGMALSTILQFTGYG